MRIYVNFKSVLIGIWILNCLLGIIIAIKEVWLPSMKAQENPYQHIVSDPFDGTVMPIEHIPNWSKEAYRDKSILFSNIPKNDLLPLPLYNTSLLKKDITTSELLRLKFTYTVLYMGSYKLNYTEYDGSHLGVDIRSVIGMPVRSIANGVVIKTVEADATGNKFVVIRHDNVPRNGKTETLFSSYLHLSKIHVQAGQKVAKGQVIGNVGTTGITTTPHLHFQIDTIDAPFHPYWPYTSNDARQAGVSFLGGVNANLGKENAMKYTINPMEFVQAHLHTSVIQTTMEASNPPLEDLTQYTDSPETTLNPHLEDIIRFDRDDIIVAGSTQRSTHATACNTQFRDLAHTPQLQFLQGNRCIFGNLENTFNGNTAISRAEALKILMKFYGETPQENSISSILDIPLSDSELQGLAARAYDLGVLRSSLFYPNRNATRGEFIELLSRFGKLSAVRSGASYTDVSAQYDFSASIKLYANSIHKNEKQFRPESVLTRADVLSLLSPLVQE